MKFLVQKYGGTSVGTIERIRHVAAKAIKAKRDGHAVVLVVSAMAGETNRLLALSSQLCPQSATAPFQAESDVVAATGEAVAAALTAMAIQVQGVKSRSFMGHQLPIETDSSFGQGSIRSVNIKPIVNALENNEIPVIAGFQGVDALGRITTLGRGGSDTTAVAVAAALGSATCEIYTDVDGIYTADPNTLNSAFRLPQVSYPFMIEASGLGAKVMHDRSVMMGMRYQVPIQVKSSFVEGEGTEIGCRETHSRCVAVDTGLAKVSYFSREAEKGLLEVLKEAKIPHRLVGNGPVSCQEYLVPKRQLSAIPTSIGSSAIFVDADIARVSVIGDFIGSTPQIIAETVSIYRNAGINSVENSVGLMSFSSVLPLKKANEAASLLHAHYVEKENPKLQSLGR